MKRFSMIFILFVMVISGTTSFAAGHPTANTVAEAKVSGVDTDVVLTGHIVKNIHENEFLFTDNTGELLLYIDDANMQKIAKDSKDLKVSGKIVQNFMYTQVDADSVVANN